MPSLDERREILANLNLLAVQDITDLWRDASMLDIDSTSFRSVIKRGVPELVAPYESTAGELTALWYGESAPELSYRAVPAALAPVEQLSTSASWALYASGEQALMRLAGTAQRAIFNASRETILGNSNAEAGSTWARHASGTACAFCRMMATRGDVYASEASAVSVVGRGKEMSLADRKIRAAGGERRKGGQFAAGGIKMRGTRKAGQKYHDKCHCIAVEVRPGRSYTPPPYVEKWNEEYKAAVLATEKVGEFGAIDAKAVLAHMRASENAAKAARAGGAAVDKAAPAAKTATGGGKPPIKPPTGGQAVSGAADDRSWRVPDDKVPESYPELARGDGKVHFAPQDRPDVETKREHIMRGDKNGGGHGDGAGMGKSEFTGWTEHQVMAAVDLTLAAPHSVVREGSTLYFRRLVDGTPVEARVAARKPTPTLRTAYPNWDALNSIAKGEGELLWGV